MYETFYGLHERPFDLTTNPRFLFLTPRHREDSAPMKTFRDWLLEQFDAQAPPVR